MTFIDDAFKDLEEVSYQSVRHLQIWLSTVSPINSPDLLRELESFCYGMKWPLVWDEQLKRKILRKL